MDRGGRLQRKSSENRYHYELENEEVGYGRDQNRELLDQTHQFVPMATVEYMAQEMGYTDGP